MDTYEILAFESRRNALAGAITEGLRVALVPENIELFIGKCVYDSLLSPKFRWIFKEFGEEFKDASKLDMLDSQIGKTDGTL